MSLTEEEFWAALAPLPEPLPPLYRLYYNERGEPLFYSQEDLPGKYIDIDRAVFADTPTNVRVINGVLTYTKTTSVSKLAPGDFGTPCHPSDVSVVVSAQDPHVLWDLK